MPSFEIHFVKENKSSGSITPLVITKENNETSMRVTDRENAYFTSISTISEDPSALPKLMTSLIKISEQEVIDILKKH